MIATEITNIDLGHLVPGARFFSTSDNKYLVIDADLTDYPTEGITFIRRPTAVLYSNDRAIPFSMNGDHIFDPGTTAEDALTSIGYELA